jgi:hypothetical protein
LSPGSCSQNDDLAALVDIAADHRLIVEQRLLELVELVCEVELVEALAKGALQRLRGTAYERELLFEHIDQYTKQTSPLDKSELCRCNISPVPAS